MFHCCSCSNEDGYRNEGVDRPGYDDTSLLPLVSLLIDSGAQINAISRFRWGLRQYPQSPLSVAAKYSSPEIVRLLVEKGADMDFLTNGNILVLHKSLYSIDELMMTVNRSGALFFQSAHHRPTLSTCGP
jgi:hypothetical protein